MQTCDSLASQPFSGFSGDREDVLLQRGADVETLTTERLHPRSDLAKVPLTFPLEQETEGPRHP